MTRAAWKTAGALALAGILISCGGDKPANEAELEARLIALSKQTLEERYPAGQTTERFNQPRHIGCLRGTFEVDPDLPDDLQAGLFTSSAFGSYPTWIRFANASSEPDTEKDFRGMSIKVMGVDGPKLLGNGSSQDFVLNSWPVLFAATPEDFLDFIDKSLNSSRLLFFATHWRSFRIAMAGRQHHAGHLAIPYWSTTPSKFGEGRVVKYRARPCGGVTSEPVDDPTEGYLLDAMRGQLAGGGACFEFAVQFQTDPESMPIDNASVEWKESESPFRTVATIQIPSQQFESRAQMEFCENLAFNPWHSLAEHEPLGAMNRVRKGLYRELAEFRHQRNGVTNYTEPVGDETF